MSSSRPDKRAEGLCDSAGFFHPTIFRLEGVSNSPLAGGQVNKWQDGRASPKFAEKHQVHVLAHDEVCLWWAFRTQGGVGTWYHAPFFSKKPRRTDYQRPTPDPLVSSPCIWMWFLNQSQSRMGFRRVPNKDHRIERDGVYDVPLFYAFNWWVVTFKNAQLNHAPMIIIIIAITIPKYHVRISHSLKAGIYLEQIPPRIFSPLASCQGASGSSR